MSRIFRSYARGAAGRPGGPRASGGDRATVLPPVLPCGAARLARHERDVLHGGGVRRVEGADIVPQVREGCRNGTVRMDRSRGEAFDGFVAARWPALFHLSCLLVGGDRHRAEDLLQEALVKLWFGWPRNTRTRPRSPVYARVSARAAGRSARRRRWGSVPSDRCRTCRKRGMCPRPSRSVRRGRRHWSNRPATQPTGRERDCPDGQAVPPRTDTGAPHRARPGTSSSPGSTRRPVSRRASGGCPPT